MEETGKKKSKMKTVIGFIVGIGTIILVQQFFFKTPSFDKAMMEAASEINKSCPFMVDQYTRLDNVVALPNNTFQYNYSLINMNKEDVDIVGLTNYLEPTIVNNVKTNPDLKAYRDNKTTMAYYYKDKNGNFITKIEVSEDKYAE